MGGFSQGPFSEELVPQTQRTPQLNPNTPPTKAGGAFFLASKFLEGAAQSRAQSFARSEQQKQAQVEKFSSWANSIVQNPDITPEAKAKFQQGAHDVLFQEVGGALNKAKDKDHPVLGAAKSIFEGLTGGKYKSTKPDPKALTEFMAANADLATNPQYNRQTYLQGAQDTFGRVQDELTKQLGRAPYQEELHRHPEVIKAMDVVNRNARDPAHARSIFDTHLGGFQSEPKPGSAEAIEIQNQSRYGAPPAAPTGDPPAPRQQSEPGGTPPPLATLPNGRPTLQQPDTGEPPAPRGAQGQPPQGSDSQFFADMSRSPKNYVARTATSGMSGGKPAEGILVRSPYPERNGYYSPSGERLKDFSPRPTAAEEKPQAPPVTKIFYDDKHPKGIERAWTIGEDGKGKWVDTGGTGKPNKPAKAAGGSGSDSENRADKNKFEAIEAKKNDAMEKASEWYSETRAHTKGVIFAPDSKYSQKKDPETGKSPADLAFESQDKEAVAEMKRRQQQAQKNYENEIAAKKGTAATGEPPAPRGASAAPPAAKFPGTKAPKPNSPVTEDVMDQYYDLYNGDKEQMRKALIANGFHLGGK